MSTLSTLIIRCLHQQAYESTWQAMQTFTQTRTTETPDELWLLEHPPIFTLGQAGKEEHILNRYGIISSMDATSSKISSLTGDTSSSSPIISQKLNLTVIPRKKTFFIPSSQLQPVFTKRTIFLK